MFERALQLKEDLSLYSARFPGSFNVTNADWDLLGKLITLLGLFHGVTENMSYCYANIGEIIPFVKILKNYVSDELNKQQYLGLVTTLNLFNTSFDRRFNKYLIDLNCIFATYLDPRHKNAFDDEGLDSMRHIDNVEKMLITKYLELKAEQSEIEKQKKDDKETQIETQKATQKETPKETLN